MGRVLGENVRKPPFGWGGFSGVEWRGVGEGRTDGVGCVPPHPELKMAKILNNYSRVMARLIGSSPF